MLYKNLNPIYLDFFILIIKNNFIYNIIQTLSSLYCITANPTFSRLSIDNKDNNKPLYLKNWLI